MYKKSRPLQIIHSLRIGRLWARSRPRGRTFADRCQLQPEFAQELVDALWLKYSKWVLTISANTADYFAGYNQFQNLTVGGKTRSGVLYRVCWFV
mgnify:FL=1